MIDTTKLHKKDYLITKDQVAKFISSRPDMSANAFANLLNGGKFEIDNLKNFINKDTFESVIKGDVK